MTEKRIAPESQYDKESVLNSHPIVTPQLLSWWESLNQHQKCLYCELHPVSDLTRGHLGEIVWDVYGPEKMTQYHKRQAEDLQLNLLGAIDVNAKEKLVKLYQLQLWQAQHQ